MKVGAIFACLLRGRSTPAIRAINLLILPASFRPLRASSREQRATGFGSQLIARNAYLLHPWRCLCFAFSQITRTTPLRWMTLHLSQIFLTDALTFINQFSVLSCQCSVTATADPSLRSG